MAATADIERVVRSLYEDVWTGKDYEVAEKLFHPDFTYPAAPDLRGAEAKLQAVRSYHKSFPDLRADIEDLVTTGDRAAVRFTVSGTDLGGVRQFPPTGRAVSVWAVDLFAFQDGRIIADWVGLDWLGMLIQLGVIVDPWTR